MGVSLDLSEASGDCGGHAPLLGFTEYPEVDEHIHWLGLFDYVSSRSSISSCDRLALLPRPCYVARTVHSIHVQKLAGGRNIKATYAVSLLSRCWSLLVSLCCELRSEKGEEQSVRFHYLFYLVLQRERKVT